MIKRLFTGFAPFLDHWQNPSLRVAQNLASHFGFGNQAIELPVVFGDSFNVLSRFLKNQETFPDQLWLFGLASNRAEICLERVALNWIETRFPDESGTRFDKPSFIYDEAPEAIIQKDHPLFLSRFESDSFKISHSAGTFVCNELYFRTLIEFADFRNQIIFVHVPLESVLPVVEQTQLLVNWIEGLKT